MSLLAAICLFARFSYSVVWTNHVNVMAVRDSILGGEVRLGAEHWYRGLLDGPPRCCRCDDKVSDLGGWGRSQDTPDLIRPGRWLSSLRREHGRGRTMEARAVLIFDVDTSPTIKFSILV